MSTATHTPATAPARRPRRRRLDDLPAREDEADILHEPSLEAGREAEMELALKARLDRNREDLAVGKVLVTTARDPGAASDADGHVRAVRHDPELALLAEPPG